MSIVLKQGGQKTVIPIWSSEIGLVDINNKFEGKKNVEDALQLLKSNMGQLSNPNLLINGDFQVWQRGTEQLVDVNGTSYCADRWKVHQLNVLQSKQLTNDSRLSKYCLRVENKNTSGTQVYLTQPFEDDYIDFLNDKLVTVSFWIKGYNNATNVLYYEVGNKQVDKVYLTNEWQKVSGTVKANFVKDNINMRGITIFTAGSNPILTNQGYEISNIKLELGSVATPFVPRPYGEELVLCQRYYEYIDGDNTTYGFTSSGNTPAWATLKYVKKRVNPTVVYGNSGQGGDTWGWINYTGGIYTGQDILDITVSTVYECRFKPTEETLNRIGLDKVYLLTGYFKIDAEIY